MFLQTSKQQWGLRATLAAAVGALLLLAGCKAAPADVEDIYASLPDAVKVYLVQVQPFDSPEAILQAREYSAESLRRIVFVLETITPPAEMQQAHEELLAGYRFILEGRELLESTHDNEVVSEGHFLADWGTMRLREHERLVFVYVQNILLEQTPGGE